MKLPARLTLANKQLIDHEIEVDSTDPTWPHEIVAECGSPRQRRHFVLDPTASATGHYTEYTPGITAPRAH